MRDRGDPCFVLFFFLRVSWLSFGFEYLKINDGEVKITELTLIDASIGKILFFLEKEKCKLLLHRRPDSGLATFLPLPLFLPLVLLLDDMGTICL